jgi:hypothetical protein
MYGLTVMFGPAASMWTLLFNSEESAEQARGHLREGGMTEDDYGQRVTIYGDIHAVMVEDLERSQRVHVENGLRQLRITAITQKEMGSDPELQQAAQRAKQQAIMGGRMPIVGPRIG